MSNVPPSKKIRYKRVGNVDSQRLWQRRLWLIKKLTREMRDVDGHVELMYLSRELWAIEEELIHRGILDPAKRHTEELPCR